MSSLYVSPVRRSPSATPHRKETPNKYTVYEQCINQYQNQIKALTQQVQDLEARLQGPTEEESQVIRTYSELQRDRSRLTDQIAALSRKNQDLSSRISFIMMCIKNHQGLYLYLIFLFSK